MFSREVRTALGDHEIVVTNEWAFPLSTHARLYIDGSRVDDSRTFYSDGTTPLLRGALVQDGTPRRIEVFARSGWIGIQIKICVDGEPVGGDSF